MEETDADFHILIIDDDLDDHFFFINALNSLKSSGFTKNEKIIVSSVYSGNDGINFLLKKEKYRSSKKRLPDFIVLDLFMPVKDGYEILCEIKRNSQLKNIPVYILTSEMEHCIKCLDEGCAGFFSKPPESEDLQLVIMQMFKNRTGVAHE